MVIPPDTLNWYIDFAFYFAKYVAIFTTLDHVGHFWSLLIHLYKVLVVGVRAMCFILPDTLNSYIAPDVVSSISYLITLVF